MLYVGAGHKSRLPFSWYHFKFYWSKYLVALLLGTKEQIKLQVRSLKTSTHPGKMIMFASEGAQCLKTSSDRPPLSIPGVANNTHGPGASIFERSKGNTVPTTTTIHEEVPLSWNTKRRSVRAEENSSSISASNSNKYPLTTCCKDYKALKNSKGVKSS